MAKLGTKQRPAVLRVQTAERAGELMEICNEHGSQAIVGVEPVKPEDRTDLDRLLHPPAPARAAPTTARNDPCPCGSGRNFKKCCGA
jgi:SWIM/SEC-C metal-binding protein